MDSFKKVKPESKESSEKMDEVQQMIYNQGEANSFVRGKAEGKAEIVRIMLKNGIPFEVVENMLDKEYSTEMVKEILYQAQL